MELTVEDVAKIMADFIGHRMTEKCERHAQAIMPILESIERETAVTCAAIAKEHKDCAEGRDNFDTGYRGASRHIISSIATNFNLGE